MEKEETRRERERKKKRKDARKEGSKQGRKGASKQASERANKQGSKEGRKRGARVCDECCVLITDPADPDPDHRSPITPRSRFPSEYTVTSPRVSPCQTKTKLMRWRSSRL